MWQAGPFRFNPFKQVNFKQRAWLEQGLHQRSFVLIPSIRSAVQIAPLTTYKVSFTYLPLGSTMILSFKSVFRQALARDSAEITLNRFDKRLAIKSAPTSNPFSQVNSSYMDLMVNPKQLEKLSQSLQIRSIVQTHNLRAD
jgi:hypothetical protein